MPDLPALPGVYPGPTEASVFIAVNRNTSPRRAANHHLALVDAIRAEEVAPLHWKTTDNGHVYRCYMVREIAKILSESLGSRILGTHRTANNGVFYRNGDRLDLRAENILPSMWDGPRSRPPEAGDFVRASSTFVNEPSFRAAWAQRLKDSEALRREYPIVRRSALTPFQIRFSLKEIASDLGSMINSIDDARGYFKATFEIDLTLQQTRDIITGKQQRQRGFENEYAAIAAAFPTRAQLRAKRLHSLLTS